MPRVPKNDRLPDTIKPANWRKLVATAIPERLHPGRGGDDTGGLAPLALRMLKHREMTWIIKRFIVANKGQFSRFDSDKDNGIDLVDIIHKCVFYGKEVRPPEYDLHLIKAELPKATSTEWLKLLAEGAVLIGEQCLLQKEQKRPQEIQINFLMMELNDHLQRRFGKGIAWHEEIAMLLRITPWMTGPIHTYVELGDKTITAVAVKKRLDRQPTLLMDKQAKMVLKRRQWKARFRTGNEEGYRTPPK